jgi:hypothetical protein
METMTKLRVDVNNSATTETMSHSSTLYVSSFVSSDYSSNFLSQKFLIVACIIALLVNAMVLAVLISDRSLLKSTTNVFICSQTFTDSLACVALSVNMFLQMYQSSGGIQTFGQRLQCWLFDSSNITMTCVYASQAGLVIITIERYIKVVHPIIHRNCFRPWMIKLGIILPWMNGIIIWFIPNAAMTSVVNGFCSALARNSVPGKIFITTGAIWQVPIPIATFIFCYWKIVMVIRQKRAVTPHAVVVISSSTAMTTSSMREQDEHSPKQHKMTQAQASVIKTMITVTLCFTLCWSPVMICNTLYLYHPTQAVARVLQPLGFVAYINMLLNPVIYSCHLSVVSRIRGAFKRVMNLDVKT